MPMVYPEEAAKKRNAGQKAQFYFSIINIYFESIIIILIIAVNVY